MNLRVLQSKTLPFCYVCANACISDLVLFLTDASTYSVLVPEFTVNIVLVVPFLFGAMKKSLPLKHDMVI